MSSLTVTKRFNRTRLICLVVCAVLLISSVVAVSFAWFRGVIEKPGGTITTGKIIVNAAGYQVDSPSSFTKIYEGGIDGANDALNDIEPDETFTDKYDITMDENGEYTILYVVQKTSKSIDVDVQLQLAIVEGANDELNGFRYYMSAVEVDLTDPTNEEAVKSDLANYLASDTSKLPDDSFMKHLSNLKSDSTRVTINNERSYGVIRFSVRLDENARNNLTRYSGQTYRLRTSFTVAQVGHITDDYTGNLWLVSSLAELQNALKLYVPGDTIRITNYINWSGDLNFNRPVRFEIVGSQLQVNGNVNFSYAYSGDFYFDASAQGQLLIMQQGGYGGNFNIDTPLANFNISGSGNTQPSQGDIYLQGNLYADVSFDEGVSEGLTLNRVVIRDGSVGISDAAAYKGVYVMDNSKVNVAANTYISEIIARDRNNSIGYDGTTYFIRIENRGEIGTVNLRYMTETEQSVQHTLEYPQIYIHNYTTIVMVNLPTWSTKWKPNSLEDGKNDGNTRIVCELGAEVGLNAVTGFTEDDIEYPNSDLERVEIVDEDNTHLRINYFLKKDEESTSFEELVRAFLLEHTEVKETEVKTLEVRCYGLPMSPDDYAYINGWTDMERHSREDGRGFKNVVTLDLGEAYSQDRLTPDYAFYNLKFLEHLELPQDNAWGTTDGNYAFATEAPIEELYIPATYTETKANAWTKIKYLHVQNVSNVILYPGNFKDGSCRNVFLANDTMVQMYRTYAGTYGGNDYRSWSFRFALEGTHYGNVWANILSDGTVQITAYDRQLDIDSKRIDLDRYNADKVGFRDKNGRQVAFDYKTLTIDGETYQVSEIYSYAFYNLISTDITDLTFEIDSANTITFGDKAFYNAGFRSVALKNPNATVSIGFETFRNCEQLRTLDIAGAGTIGENGFRECKNLRYAICPKITSLGVTSFWTCNTLYVADFPCVTQTMYTFSAPELKFARTGVISQTFPNRVDGVNATNKTSDIFGWRSRLCLYLINSPKEMPSDMDTSTLYNPFGVWHNSYTNAIVRAPMPAWLYDLYYALPYGFAGDKELGGLSHATNTSEYSYEDYRFGNYVGDGKYEECNSPYEFQYDEASGEIIGVDICDFVYILQSDGNIMFVCSNVDDTSELTDDRDEFVTPGKIEDSRGTYTVSVIGDRAFGWTSISQNKLTIASSVTTIEDRAFTILQEDINRNGLNYAFDELDLANVRHIGDYTFYLYPLSPRSTDIGFSVMSGGEQVEDIGIYAFAYNELYAVDLPAVKQIAYYAFYGNSNLYAVNVPKFQRENDTNVEMTGRQFEGCPNLRFVFVGPLYRTQYYVFNNFASIFVDATEAPDPIAAERLVKNIDYNHVFLRYSEVTDFSFYKRWAVSCSHVSFMFSEAEFGDLYVFGNQKGEEFQIDQLFRKETWYHEGITEEDKPGFTYRKLDGNNVTMVTAAGTYTGEYRVVDTVGTRYVTEIGWCDYLGGDAAEEADYVSGYSGSPYAYCDLSGVTKLYFQSGSDDENPSDKTHIEKLNHYAFYSDRGARSLGYSTWETEDGCLLDISGVEWVGYYAFGSTNITTVYSNDVEMGLGYYVFSYSYHLTTFDAPRAKSFGGSFKDDGTYDTMTETGVFYACTKFSTVKLPNAEIVYRMFEARSDYEQSLEEVYLPRLKSASQYTFNNCNRLWRVALGTDSDELTLGYYAFNGCTVLNSVTLGHEGISKLVIQDFAFNNTTALTVIGPNTNEEGGYDPVETNIGGNYPVSWTNTGFMYVTEIGVNGLRNCNGAETIDLPCVQFVGSYSLGENELLVNVKLGSEGHDVYLNGSSIFYLDPLLVDLSLPHVTKGDAGCLGNMLELQTITLENIKELDYNPFNPAPKLETINFGHANDDEYEFAVPQGVLTGTNITRVIWPYITAVAPYAFDGRTTLEYVELANVHTIGDFAFRSCRGLVATSKDNVCIILGSPERLEKGGVHIGKDAFWSSGDTGNLGYIDMEYVTSMDQYDVFYNNNITEIHMKNLKTITETATQGDRGTFAFRVVYGLKVLELPALEEIQGTSTGTFDARTQSTLVEADLRSLKVLPQNYFYNCTALTTAILDSVTSIGASAFSGCGNLQFLNTEGNNTLKHVSSIGNNAFLNCSSLATFILEYDEDVAEDAKLTELGASVFNNCGKLQTVVLPSLTRLSGASNFINCKELINVEVPMLESIEGATNFEGCNALEYIELPSLTLISADNTFHNCTNLKEIELLALERIAGYTFNGCTGLTSAIFGPNMQAITNHYNFTGCSSLGQIVMQCADMEFYRAYKGYYLFSAGASEMLQKFRLFVPYTVYQTMIDERPTFGAYCFNLLIVDRFVPVEQKVEGKDGFDYYVAKIETVSTTDYYQVVYILPNDSLQAGMPVTAEVPDTVTEGGDDYIISVAPSAWAGLTEDVVKIDFPRRMTVFHDNSMIYMPSSVKEFSIPTDGVTDNYFKIVDGMLFDKDGETLVAVPKAYEGKDGTKAIAIVGLGELKNVKVISANAFYGSAITRVFIDNQVYISSSAFARSALQALWFTDKSYASYFIGSDIFSGTAAEIYVYHNLRDTYAHHDIGSDYLLAHLHSWGGEGDEYQDVPEHFLYIIQ